MQAITTKYLGPTNSSGARVSARCQARRITVAWDHAIGVDANHARAAKALAEALKWAGTWVSGGLSDGCGFAFVCVERAQDGSFVVEAEPVIAEPVTVGGWYKTTDGRWADVAWRNGQTVILRVAAKPEVA